MNNHNENEIAVTVAYDGPKEFVATDRTHQTLRSIVRAERSIPV